MARGWRVSAFAASQMGRSRAFIRSVRLSNSPKRIGRTVALPAPQHEGEG